MQGFTTEKLIEKIREAEELSQYIDTNLEKAKTEEPDTKDVGGAIIRFAIVGDEATALIQQAEELLSGEELVDLEAEVYALNEEIDLWSKYKDNPRRFRIITGQEIFDVNKPTED